MYLLGILCLVVTTAALPVLPDPPTLRNSVAAAHQDSKIHTYIQNADPASIPLHYRLTDNKNNEQVTKDMLKIASVVSPPPRQLHPSDYSTLIKHKADKKHLYEELVNQNIENSKYEQESVIPEEPLQVQFPPNTGTRTNSIRGLQDCEGCANFLIMTSDSARVEDKKNDEIVRNNIVIMPSILIPTLPEQQLLDYSIVKKQVVGQNQKKCAQVKVPTNPATFLDSVPARQNSEVRTIILSECDDSDVADNNDDKEARHNMVKFAKGVMSPSPELPPFDYSVLRKQKADIKLNVATDAAPEEENNDNEEVKMTRAKIGSTVIPTPPELPPFDYSVLRKHKADIKLNVATDAAPEEENNDNEEVKMTRVKIGSTVIPTPPELSPFDYSVLSKHKADLKLNVATDAVPEEENNDNEEVKMTRVKIGSTVIPTPPELPPFDYSILRKHKAALILKCERSAKQAPKKYKAEKETVNLDLEKPDKVEVPLNPPTLPDSVAALPVSKMRKDILNVATDAAPEEENNDNEEVKMTRAKIGSTVIPTPPELPPFDYSVLRKHKADIKLNVATDAAPEEENNDNEEVKMTRVKIGSTVIPTPPELSPFDYSVLSKHKADLKLNVATDAVPEEENNDNEEVKMTRVKIGSTVIPTPPELPPFDYSILRKHKAALILKCERSAKQAPKKYKAEKETVNLDLEKPDKVEVPLNPPTLPDSVAALPVSKMRKDILNVATDAAPEEENNDNEEVKMTRAKIASTVIPTPPELPPFDYSILRKHKAALILKCEHSAKQAAKKYKAEKEMVNLDLEKPNKVKVPLNPPTLPDSVAALPVSKMRKDILNVATDAAPEEENNDNEDVKMTRAKIGSTVIPTPPELPPFDYSVLSKHKANLKLNVATDAVPEEENNDNEDVKMTRVKIGSTVIPTSPELPPFDYSILRKQKANINLKSEHSAKQAVEKYKAEKETVIPPPEVPLHDNSFSEKPIKVIVEPKFIKVFKFVGDSKPMAESNTVEESIPNTPFFSKSISNCPPLPSFGLNWPFHRPSMSRCPPYYPNFDFDGTIYSN